MAYPDLGPCDVNAWATGAEVLACGAIEGITDPASPLVVEAIAAAAGWLWLSSGSRFGICAKDVRPTVDQLVFDTAWMTHARSAYIYNAGGFWSGGWFCGCCGGPGQMLQRGSCGATPAVDLGWAPLRTITAVTIDGQVLDPAHYAIVDNTYLLRIDGQVWPCCQQRALPVSAVGTWHVGITYGVDVPALGRMATRALARELLLACTEDEACSLSTHAQQVTRQGMTVVLTDPFALLEDGKTNVGIADAFLAATNPHRLTGEPVAVIPGVTPLSTNT